MWKLSVVGSGPIRMPGKSFSNKYLPPTPTQCLYRWEMVVNVGSEEEVAPDEGGLARGVLPDQHHQRLPVKVRVLEHWRVHVMVSVFLNTRSSQKYWKWPIFHLFCDNVPSQGEEELSCMFPWALNSYHDDIWLSSVNDYLTKFTMRIITNSDVVVNSQRVLLLP